MSALPARLTDSPVDDTEFTSSAQNSLSSTKVHWALPLSVFIISLLFYLPNIYLTPFSSRGEGREALVVSAMFQQQNLILPRRNGENIPSKPPLFHWTAAASSMLQGELNEFSIRLPSVLASALALALFFSFAAPRIGVRPALFATLALATSFEWSRSSVGARVDMTFSLWLVAGMFGLFQLIEVFYQSNKINWLTLFTISICLAFATLSKGPAGVVIPWAIAFIYFLFLLPIRKIPILPGVASIILSLGIAFVWYFLAYKQGGAAFLDVHLMRENVARVVGLKNYETGHSSSFLSIIPLLLLGCLPWSLLTPLLLTILWKKRRYLRLSNDRALLFCGVWASFFIVFFSITASKRIVYLLPAYPALAYIFAWTLSKWETLLLPRDREIEIAQKVSGLFFFILSFVGLIVLCSILALVILDHSVVEHLPKLKYPQLEYLQICTVLFANKPVIFFSLTLSTYLLLVAGKKIGQGEIYSFATATTIAMLSTVVTLTHLVLPSIMKFQSPQPFIKESLEMIGNKPLFQYAHEFYCAIYYANRNIPFTNKIPFKEITGEGYMLVAKKDIEKLEPFSRQIEIVKESSTPNIYGKDKFLLVKFIENPASTSYPKQQNSNDNMLVFPLDGDGS